VSIVVIGGGHNGLTCAALLAKAGRKVTLLEARDHVGGLAAREEFADSYHVPGVLHDTSGVRASIVDSLSLARHGLKRAAKPLSICAPRTTGEPLFFQGDDVQGELSEHDRGRYADYRGFIARITPVLRKLLDAPPTDPSGSLWPLLKTGLSVRRLGAADMTELARVGPMCVGDWMRDLFEDERLSAALAVGAIEGAFAGPWSGGTSLTLLLRETVADAEILGGPAAVVDALKKAAESHGVDIRTDAAVERIALGSNGVEAVVLATGETIEAAQVVATCDPKQTFLSLIGSHRIGVTLADDIRHLRVRGTSAKVHLGLTGPLELAGGEAISALRTGETLDAIERAFAAVKYRGFSKRPVLDVRVPSQQDDSLCPDGHSVVSLMVHFAARELEGGWNDAQRDALGDAAISELERYCPGVRDKIVAREVLTPADLERRYRLTGGHIHHGEHALDQLLFMRPTVDCAEYTTPVRGLFLGGSGSHPGGGVTCAPGALAARAVLKS